MSEFEPRKVAPEDVADWLKYANENGVEGFLHPAELNELVRQAQGKRVLEIGSYRGLSAWGMAHVAESITCVDTFKARTNGQDQEQEYTTLEEFDRNLAPFSNVRRLAMSSEDAAFALAGEYFDVIFIDAMHTYEDVLADIKRWLPFHNGKGAFEMHDYGHGDFPGVKQAADEIFGPAEDKDVTITLRIINDV